MVTARAYSASFPLENGDRLTRFEFRRRYEAMPDTSAELIEGIVYLASPVRIDYHAEPHADVMAWLGLYRSLHAGLRAGDNATVALDAENEFQPDAYLRREQGTARAVEGYLEGPPELVVEVTATTISKDLSLKKRVYLRAGVREYIVWRVLDEAVDWFELVDGEYILRAPDTAGIIESAQFPGLRLNVPALLSGDLAAVLAEIR